MPRFDCRDCARLRANEGRELSHGETHGLLDEPTGVQCEGIRVVVRRIEVRVSWAVGEARPILGRETFDGFPRAVGPTPKCAVEDEKPASRPDESANFREETLGLAPVECAADAGDVECGIDHRDGFSSSRDVEDSAWGGRVLKHWNGGVDTDYELRHP